MVSDGGAAAPEHVRPPALVSVRSMELRQAPAGVSTTFVLESRSKRRKPLRWVSTGCPDSVCHGGGRGFRVPSLPSIKVPVNRHFVLTDEANHIDSWPNRGPLSPQQSRANRRFGAALVAGHTNKTGLAAA